MTYLVKKGNKYGAHSTEYGGVIYHSKKEAGYAQTLDTLKKATYPSERVVSWERQVKIALDVNGEHICNYYIDFVAQMADGSTQYIEVKGFETEVWRLKWKLFEAIYKKEHPELDLIIIK